MTPAHNSLTEVIDIIDVFRKDWAEVEQLVRRYVGEWADRRGLKSPDRSVAGIWWATYSPKSGGTTLRVKLTKSWNKVPAFLRGRPVIFLRIEANWQNFDRATTFDTGPDKTTKAAAKVKSDNEAYAASLP